MGEADIAICGGVETRIEAVPIAGFAAMRGHEVPSAGDRRQPASNVLPVTLTVRGRLKAR